MSGADPSATDRRFMRAALRLGRRGLGATWPNPSVACLIVRDVEGAPVIVGAAVTAAGGRPHAETQALAEAGAAAWGATAYVTLEPCSHVGMTPPCADALIAAGVARVVIAAGDPDPRVSGRGVALLRAAGVAVTEGVEADAARRHHAGHLARVALGRPHVTLKMAVSSDGKAGLSDARVPITGAAANARMHMVRAMSDAIAVGVETARVDDPLLTVRLPGLASRSPIRVVFDPELRLPTDARLVQGAREVATHVLAAFGASPERAAALADRGVVLHSVPPPWLGRRGINLVVALRELAKLGITRLLLEGGPRLAGAFLAADLVDEAIVLQAPHAIGADGVPALGPGPLDALGAGGFELVEETALGVDRMLAYARRR